MNPLMQNAAPMMGGNPMIGNMQAIMQQVRQIKQMLSGQNVDAVAQMFAKKTRSLPSSNGRLRARRRNRWRKNTGLTGIWSGK